MRKLSAFLANWILWQTSPFRVRLPHPDTVPDNLIRKCGFVWTLGIVPLAFMIVAGFSQNWGGLFWAAIFYLALGYVYREMGREMGVRYF